jgi:glycosyltransferase involved in cell wall biosynthesis
MTANQVTVIIPTHKRLDSLRLAIESIVNQTLKATEIIIVDDVGDSSVESLVNEYEKFGTRYIANTEQTGAATSRNIGARNATTNLIAFLDDDDTWFVDKLEKQVSCFSDETVGLVYSPMLLVFPDLKIEYKTSPYTDRILLPEILVENKIGGTISVVVRRDWFEKVGGFDARYKAREEYDLWIRLVRSNDYSVQYCDVLSCRVINVISSSNRISCNIDNYIEAIDLLNDKFQSDVNEHLDAGTKKFRKSMQANFLASQAMKTGMQWSGVKYFFTAFTLNPSPGTLAKFLASMFGWKFLILLRSKVK